MTPLIPTPATPSAGGAPTRVVAGALLILATSLACQAHAQESDPLIGLINEFREAEEACGAGEAQAVGPLAPNDALAVPPATSGAQLQQELQGAGYRPSKLQAISVSGPADA